MFGILSSRRLLAGLCLSTALAVAYVPTSVGGVSTADAARVRGAGGAASSAVIGPFCTDFCPIANGQTTVSAFGNWSGYDEWCGLLCDGTYPEVACCFICDGP